MDVPDRDQNPSPTLHLEIRAPTGTVVQIGTLEIPVASGPVAPAELPARVFGFTGRTAEVATVVRAALTGHPAVQISGRPGAGKTAVAVEAGHALREHFPDGQIALELHGYDGARPPTAHELLGRVLRSLGIAGRAIPPSPTARADLYHRTLTGLRVLIVADDVASARQVADLVPPPGSFLLLTTRPALDVPQAERLHVGELDDTAATALVLRAQPSISAGTVRAVVRHCAGLPLALRILAARLGVDPDLDARDLAGASLDGLALGDRAVRESFRFSHDRLGDTAQLVFRRCAALPLVDLGVAAAAALAGTDEPTAATALHELVAAHLLDCAEPSGSLPRFRLHDLLRRYAGERLDVEPRAGVAAARHRVTMLHLHGLAATTDPATTARWLDVEWDNLLVVADVLDRTGAPGLQEIADGIVSVHDLPTPWDGWARIQHAALADALRRDDVTRTAVLQQRLGIAYREHAMYAESTAILAEAEQAFRRCGDLVGAAGAVANAAEVLRDLRRDDEAAERFAAAIAAVGDDTSSEALQTLGWAWHGLGDVRTGQGRIADALTCHRRSRACFARIDDRFGEAWALHGTGDALRARGRSAAAAGAYRQALATFDALGIVVNAGWTEQNLGELLLDLGDHAPAVRHFRRAHAAAVTRSDRHLQARALAGVGDVVAALGDGAGAARWWRRARAVLGDLAIPVTAELDERIGRGGDAPPLSGS